MLPVYFLVLGFLLELTPVSLFVVVVPFPGDLEVELDPAEEEAYFQSQLAQ